MSFVPKHLLWCDMETSSLPVGNDFTDVHIMEVAFILTDMSLNKLSAYDEVIQLTEEMADQLRHNDAVREMHKTNGLTKACSESFYTVYQAEDEVLRMLADNNVDIDRVSLAGSGVAMFDYPLIKAKMPRLASGLTYYTYDIGVFRRMLMLLTNGHHFINPSNASYGASKVHRAMADTEAHLQEAIDYREAIQKALLPPF